MSSGDVRKGITQANFNEEAFNIVFWEIIIASGLCGLFFQSWYVFGGIFLGLLVGFFIPGVGIMLAVVFSAGWSLQIANLLTGYRSSLQFVK